jgi:hypothetical protein
VYPLSTLERVLGSCIGTTAISLKRSPYTSLALKTDRQQIGPLVGETDRFLA